jgi:isoquinoline 1-oxidoreductase beta subunit
MNDLTSLSTTPAGVLSRRAFLMASGTLGGGLLLTVTIPLVALAPRLAAAEPGDLPITVYARFARSGAVTIFAPNPEMGQGTRTALPMIFAEELGVAWKDVTIEMADYMGGKLMGGQTSGGSMSTFSSWLPLRKAGAAGRQMFVTAAARTWAVSEGECSAALSVVTHEPSGRKIAYAALVPIAAALPVPDLESVRLKDESTFQIIGQSVRDPDKAKVVTGEQLFGIDVKVPGMKYAVFQKGPVFDAAVKSVNSDEIKNLPGVTQVLVLQGAERQLEGPPGHPFLVIDDALRGGVAIVADTWWHAQKARQQLKVEWDEGSHANDSTADFDAQARRMANEAPQDTARLDGDPDGALAGAAKVVHAAYAYPFISHATLEPQNCVAHYRDGKVEIWAPTQNPGAGRTGVAKALGIAPEDVTIHMYRCGGGFGRRLANDYMFEAAVISKAIGTPVKVLWSREDDLQHDFYRPGGYHNLTGGLDSQGKLIAWRNHFVGFARNQYWNVVAVPAKDAFPGGYVANYALKTSRIAFNVPIAPLRAPGDNAFAFVFQSFLDELAHAAGRDPIDFQIELLRKPLPGEGLPNPAARQPPFIPTRMITVMEHVRQQSGWASRHQLPKGVGMGFACYWSHLGYVAQVHQVAVGEGADVMPQKVWVALDIGRHIVNPINAENQVQGSVLDAISAAQGQRITIDKGRVVQSNFNDYALLRNGKMPTIDVSFVRTDNNPTGLGEPAHPSALPAYCNAIFAASGRRVHTLPVSLALAKS